MAHLILIVAARIISLAASLLGLSCRYCSVQLSQLRMKATPMSGHRYAAVHNVSIVQLMTVVYTCLACLSLGSLRIICDQRYSRANQGGAHAIQPNIATVVRDSTQTPYVSR